MTPDFVHLLKERNLSLTAVRLAVLAALHDFPHADAAHIFNVVQQRIPTATIQAVYNNLNALTEAKVIREIKPKGQASLYETRVGDNHHHLVCRECNIVMDTHCQGYAPCLSPSHNHGFIIDEAEVIFWGICASCQKSELKKSQRRKT
jgi:Fur family ferric uptake transcriptional regulator